MGWPFKSSGIHFNLKGEEHEPMRGGATAMASPSLSAPLWSAVRAQVPSTWGTGSFYPLQLPQVVCKLHSLLPCVWEWGWVTANESGAEVAAIDCNLPPSLLPEVASLQQMPEFQNSYIRLILPLQLLSGWRDRFLVLPPPPSSQNPPFRSCILTGEVKASAEPGQIL